MEFSIFTLSSFIACLAFAVTISVNTNNAKKNTEKKDIKIKE